jgi:Cd(II)/Pb(II)-responsive transcriptional regulator
MNSLMTIQALAAATHTSTDTVRYYERIGLLPAASRGSNNYRVYDQQTIERLRFILACRDLDMSHEEIMALLKVRDAPRESCGPVTQVIEEHLSHVRQRIKSLRQLQTELQRLRDACDGGGEGAQCGALLALERRAPTLASKRLAPSMKSHLR